MDSLSSAFGDDATFDDGSCPPVFYGCMDSTASNFRASANRDREGSCRYIGCLDPGALNYDAAATVPGVCADRIYGCLASAAYNYQSSANTQSGRCEHVGCTDSTRVNFDPTANLDSGRCAETFPGCTDSLATNYHPAFNSNDGSCTKGGCTNATSPKYDGTATYSDGCSCASSCATSVSSVCMDPSANNFDNPATQNNVNLGTAGNFVILSKASISVTGDIGVSPTAATASVSNFSLIYAPDADTSITAQVTGLAHAADYASSAAMLTTAISDMETAYADAASHSVPSPANSNVKGGIITGETFTAGVYFWGSNVEFTKDIYIEGNSDDRFIFRSSGNLFASSGAGVVLKADGSGGGSAPRASNIVWQVAD